MSKSKIPLLRRLIAFSSSRRNIKDSSSTVYACEDARRIYLAKQTIHGHTSKSSLRRYFTDLFLSLDLAADSVLDSSSPSASATQPYPPSTPFPNPGIGFSTAPAAKTGRRLQDPGEIPLATSLRKEPQRPRPGQEVLQRHLPICRGR